MLNNYRSALITGGSSGIGLELAHRLAETGMELCLVSENLEQLKKAKLEISEMYPKVQVTTMCHDLSREEEVEALCRKIDALDYDIDLLVNNAGFAAWGHVLQNDITREKAMISLMINGVYGLTRHFLQRMVNRDQGCIVNVSSIAAFQPNPTLATYGAAKSFVYYWTRSIREELLIQGSRVQCITICPTPVRTNFQKSASMEQSELFDSLFAVDPEDVAEGILKAIRLNKDKIVPVKWLEIVQKVTLRFPESWRIWIGKKMLGTKDD